MPLSKVQGVAIAGVAAAVPEAVSRVADMAEIFGDQEVAKVVESTGVAQRRVAGRLCSSDLCFAAAERLLESDGIDKSEIDALIFVSQTPDYILPATSCVLHGRLGLPKSCAAFDINLGCSGYVYGLWVVSNLVAAGGIRKALLLAGDTITRVTSPEDRSVSLLFGDAGTATLLEYKTSAPPMYFLLGTDGTGADKLQIPAGGFRCPVSPETAQRTERPDGNKRAETDLYMNGPEVFAFTLNVVPKMVRQLIEHANRSLDDYDAFIMHQANRFMLEHLAKRIKIPREKLILGLENYGNTSCSSIPLAMVTELRESLTSKEGTYLLAGFGVGLSWAAASFQTGPIVVPELVFVSESEKEMLGGSDV